MPTDTDHEGRPIPENEPLDKVITVWSFSPHISNDYDTCVFRSWHDLPKQVANMIESRLDSMHPNIPATDDPFVVKIWTSKMTLGDYLELCESEP